jgi:hypothetical protein
LRGGLGRGMKCCRVMRVDEVGQAEYPLQHP